MVTKGTGFTVLGRAVQGFGGGTEEINNICGETLHMVTKGTGFTVLGRAVQGFGVSISSTHFSEFRKSLTCHLNVCC
jgi:hypothetical protein